MTSRNASEKTSTVLEPKTFSDVTSACHSADEAYLWKTLHWQTRKNSGCAVDACDRITEDFSCFLQQEINYKRRRRPNLIPADCGRSRRKWIFRGQTHQCANWADTVCRLSSEQLFVHFSWEGGENKPTNGDNRNENVESQLNFSLHTEFSTSSLVWSFTEIH